MDKLKMDIPLEGQEATASLMPQAEFHRHQAFECMRVGDSNGLVKMSNRQMSPALWAAAKERDE
jgi:hypothetical protein